MDITYITTESVKRAVINCETYKEAKKASVDFVLDHSGMIMETLGGNTFIILDSEYRTIATIHYKGFRNE